MTDSTMSTTPDTMWEVRLAKHLKGDLGTDTFDLVQVPTPEPVTGEVLVRTDYLGLSVAYLEMLRADSRLPIPPWEVGQRIGGGAVGTVVRSISADLAVGDQVRTMAGWCEYSAGSADRYPKLDPDLFPSPVHYLSQGPPPTTGCPRSPRPVPAMSSSSPARRAASGRWPDRSPSAGAPRR
ncbi:hypothetical protein [Streptomyces sp. NBC_00057]|uniref:hypothetical protein n=1 Tax=Streptomyces sp. NBC_00057 TaxID=2975634 RepID=UPI0032454D25